MFLLNPSSINKTLFYRIKSTLDLEPVTLEKSTAKSSPSKATSPKKRGKAKQSATSPTKTEQPLPPQITFVDSSNSAEQPKKESFENFEEANSVVDYLMSFKNELDFDNMAIMSPLRTQALLIRNLVHEGRKSDLGDKISDF